MASRTNWKGFLKLSLATCPVALYPGDVRSRQNSFQQINNTDIRDLKVDADSGEEVPPRTSSKVTRSTKIGISKSRRTNCPA